ncbi:TIGR02444 family protein [Brevundimonas naejangsanensis]|uniref:TIGR02444 family protein n=1 Tax=Brevundimonas naejangsanensis TaxID=588932 RepID=A0A494RMR9_9CAUL|nr:TIGR02444 family protein [Brevundimonas naejangsanensis]AYG95322.1 TIGR02444 family protein [Brevundimonas naejangsanensis]
MSDDLWTWACAAYAAPGAAEACLSLQDYHEQNVPLLLWAAWTAVTGRRPDEETIEAACDTARAWQTTTIAPLRAVRRTLKAPVPDLETEARLAVRDQVKAAELAAERHLLEGLQALAPAPAEAPRPPLDALVETARLWDRVVPRPALRALADLLPA